MIKIIALGGGEIGRPGYPVETTAIDKEIIRLSGRKRPRLLFLPTASGDSASYAAVVTAHFGGRLGCSVETGYILGKDTNITTVRQLIKKADIIYVGGGNTLRMMTAWRRTGLDKDLIKAAQAGKVLAGISAGAICWFRYGDSDSRRFTSGIEKHIRVRGLGLIPLLFSPHHDVEKSRPAELKRLMRHTPGIIGLGMDNCAAIEIIGKKYRIVCTRPRASAVRAVWQKQSYLLRRLETDGKFRPLSELTDN